MKIQTFIEKAIEGGWEDAIQAPAPSMFHWSEKRLEEGYTRICEQSVLLDPLAWQAVGKVEGWEKKCWIEMGIVNETLPTHDGVISQAQYHMHRMIDALAEGKTIEQFIETL